MVSLKQLIPHLNHFGVGDERINAAISELTEVLHDLDQVTVKGRDDVDTLLGCMMAVEAIVGGDKPNG